MRSLSRCHPLYRKGKGGKLRTPNESKAGVIQPARATVPGRATGGRRGENSGHGARRVPALSGEEARSYPIGFYPEEPGR